MLYSACSQRLKPEPVAAPGGTAAGPYPFLFPLQQLENCSKVKIRVFSQSVKPHLPNRDL